MNKKWLYIKSKCKFKNITDPNIVNKIFLDYSILKNSGNYFIENFSNIKTSQNLMLNEVRVVDNIAFFQSIKTTPVIPVEPSDTQAPTSPTSLAVSNITDTSLTLNWGASTDNVAVLNYEIEQRLSVGPGSWIWIATITNLTLNVSGLSEATNYDFRVRAIDTSYNISNWTTITNIQTLDVTSPTSPTNITSSTSVFQSRLLGTFNWQPSTDNVGVTGYDAAFRALDSSFSTVTISTSAIGIFYQPYKYQHRFRVRARDAAGNVSAWSPDDTGLLTSTWQFVAPTVNIGQINVMIQDGIGGWYIGGSFTSITDSIATYTTGYTRLARLQPNGLVDPSFSCPVNNGAVLALEINSDSLYVAGSFSGANSISTSTRNRIARVGAITNSQPAIVDTWAPFVNNTIRAMKVIFGNVYIGGDFTTVEGGQRNFLASISANSVFVTNWNPNANAPVYTFAFSGTSLIIGGAFTLLGGVWYSQQTRNRLASLNTDSIGSLNSWAPSVVGSFVSSLFYDYQNNKIYVGGIFTSISGVTRNNIARLSAFSTTPENWNPNALPSGSEVTSIVRDSVNGFIYIGGTFTTLGDVLRNRVARVSDGDVATLSDWDPNVLDSSGAASVTGILTYPDADKILIVGNFNNVINQVSTAGIDIASLEEIQQPPAGTTYTFNGGLTPSVSGTQAEGPFNLWYRRRRLLYLYTSSFMGVDLNGKTIYQIGFECTGIGSANRYPMPGYTIRIKSDNSTSISTQTNPTGMTTIRSASNFTPAVGWNMITLPTPFVMTGTSLWVEICWSQIPNNYEALGTHRTVAFSGARSYQDDSAGSACTVNLNASLTNNQPILRVVAT